MKERYDVIIVGGGHNGLVCGAYLARAGLDVCVLERREVIGGAAVTEEVWPGYKISTASYVMSLMQPKIIEDLELRRFGLEVLETPPLFVPFPGGGHVVLWSDLDKASQELSRFSKKDALAYKEFVAHLKDLAAIFRELLFETPVDIRCENLSDLWATLKLVWRYRKYRSSIYDAYDLLTLSAADYLNKWFESEEVKAFLGFYAGQLGGLATAMTPGSAYVLIRPYLRDNETPAGASGLVRGGMGSISESIRRSGEHHGMEVYTNVEVARICVRDNQATGVLLPSGEEINARIVVSNASSQKTFLELLEASDLPSAFLGQVRAIRTQSAMFRINLALSDLPRFRNFPSEEMGVGAPALVRIGPSLQYIEDALSDAKAGRVSRHPFGTVIFPSVCDDTLAPEGQHIAQILGGYAPYDPSVEDIEAVRVELLERMLAVMEEYAPGFQALVTHTQVLTPMDLEQIFGLPSGHVHHGEMTADQIFFKRPIAGYADYRTPIARLYQSSASCHPGGGVTGVPGHNAARELLADWRKGL